MKDDYFDDTPGLREVSDYEILEELRKITTSATRGEPQLEAYASCIITGIVIDKLE